MKSFGKVLQTVANSLQSQQLVFQKETARIISKVGTFYALENSVSVLICYLNRRLLVYNIPPLLFIIKESYTSFPFTIIQKGGALQLI